jgi:hypothetical protein
MTMLDKLIDRLVDRVLDRIEQRRMPYRLHIKGGNEQLARIVGDAEKQLRAQR